MDAGKNSVQVLCRGALSAAAAAVCPPHLQPSFRPPRLGTRTGDRRPFVEGGEGASSPSALNPLLFGGNRPMRYPRHFADCFEHPAAQPPNPGTHS